MKYESHNVSELLHGASGHTQDTKQNLVIQQAEYYSKHALGSTCKLKLHYRVCS